MIESAIQAKILKYLATLPECWVVKVIQANKNGTPDLIACVQGRFLALEVKSATGRPSPIQLHQIEMIRQAGGVVEIVRSVDDVKKLVDSMSQGM